MDGARASEAAKAVNSILNLSSDDQQSLLEVIEDYFCFSSDADQEDSDLSEVSGKHDRIGNTVVKALWQI